MKLLIVEHKHQSTHYTNNLSIYIENKFYSHNLDVYI